MSAARSDRPPLLAVAAALSALLIGAGTLHAQAVERQLEATETRLEDARAEHLDLISPDAFEEAEEKYLEARQRYDRGGRIEDIRNRLQEAERELARAREAAEVGRVLLQDALAARSDALAANAPEFAPELWAEAEERILDAGERAERGDQRGARERAQRAEREYRQAELTAIRADVLGRAREAGRTAGRLDADELAPATFGRADSLLQEAERVLQSDRTQRTEARALAEEAAEQFQHAAQLAQVADSVDSEDLRVETLMLRAERQLERIAGALRFEARFLEGLRPVTEQALVAIESLYEARAALEEDVRERGEEIARLNAQIDSLDAVLASLQEREATVQAELRERERRERRLREVRAVFDRGEAEVLLGEDELIIRLLGLSFPSGSDEIRPENFSLLTKVQRVIREFPDAGITVEGHTDAVGNEELNQALSERRAIAVREYLLANMALSADRIRAVGYGENRPIATNDTAEGRARNRRTDVRLDLGDG